MDWTSQSVYPLLVFILPLLSLCHAAFMLNWTFANFAVVQTCSTPQCDFKLCFFYQSNQQQPPLPSNWEKDWTTSSSKSWTTMLPAVCFSVLHPLCLVVLCYLCVFWSLIDFLIVSLIWINKQDEPADWGSVLQRTFWVGSLLCCSLKGGKRLPSDGHAHHQVVIKES